MSDSCSRLGYPMASRTAKRSNWASGKEKVPSYSTGFMVAITMNGVGRLSVCPSTVTWCSSIASRRADCVLGGRG